MRIAYDGTDFCGWQIQPGAPTIQGKIEEALGIILRHRPDVVGSGRTDAGVHARGQVAHFDLPEPIDTLRVKGSLNGLLPDSIGILSLDAAPDTFHARYDARLRTYHYYIATEKAPLSRSHRYLVKPSPDFALMNEAAQMLCIRENFSAFCRTQSETKNRVCFIQKATWLNETYEGHWVFKIEADRFLHGMVRAIVGTLLEIGRGNRSVNDLPETIASRDRRMAGPAAPALGLVLEKVSYEPE